MKISKDLLVRIVREELSRLVEADLADAEQDGAEKDKKAPPKQAQGKSPEDQPEEPKDLPVQDDPSDEKLDAQQDDAEDAEKPEVEGNKVSDEISGKTVQSITADSESKILPGAQEIVIQFDQMPDPLRILVTKTGQVRYFFRGAVHNEL